MRSQSSPSPSRRRMAWWATFVVAWALAGGAGCHDADRYVLTSDESVPVDRLFSLTVEGDTVLAADGFSRVRLRAHVADVRQHPRTVLFTTTAGTLRVGEFAVTRSDSDSLRLPTDTAGDAVVTLQASRTAGEAVVVATIEDLEPLLSQQVAVRFRPVTVDEVLRFVTVPDTVRVSADGTPVEVEIAAGLEGEDRRVTFTTTRGSFAAATVEGGQTRSLLAGDDGRAQVILQVPDEPGEALLRVRVRDFTQERLIQFQSEATLAFVEAPSTAAADGATLSEFVVEVEGAGAGDAERTVEFRTTGGTLVHGDDEGRTVSVVADADDRASVQLRSPTEVQLATVTASLAGDDAERAIRFELAPPDSVYVAIEPDKFRLTPDAQTEVWAFLTREPGRGQVSKGLDVSFSAVDSLGNPVPQVRFFNTAPADSAGVATTTFTPDGSDFRGLVIIGAEWSRGGVSVSGSTSLRIVDTP